MKMGAQTHILTLDIMKRVPSLWLLEWPTYTTSGCLNGRIYPFCNHNNNHQGLVSLSRLFGVWHPSSPLISIKGYLHTHYKHFHIFLTTSDNINLGHPLYLAPSTQIRSHTLLGIMGSLLQWPYHLNQLSIILCTIGVTLVLPLMYSFPAISFLTLRDIHLIILICDAYLVCLTLFIVQYFELDNTANLIIVLLIFSPKSHTHMSVSSFLPFKLFIF